MGSAAELTGVTYISIDQQLWVKTFMPGPFISHVCVWVGIKLRDYSRPHYLVTCENPSSSSSSSLCIWHPFWWSITGHRDAWASKLLQTFWSVAHINANVLVLILWWPSFSLCYPFPESLLPNFLALPMLLLPSFLALVTRLKIWLCDQPKAELYGNMDFALLTKSFLRTVAACPDILLLDLIFWPGSREFEFKFF